MDFYKKIFKSRKIRFRILSMLRFVPDVPMLKFQYRIKCGRPLNLENPQRYTEKLQWYKLYYRDPVMQQCADKYQVREYVKRKGLDHILNELYAVYETPEQIDLEILPEKFVLKLSNGSNTNLLCRDKSELDPEKVRQTFRDFLRQSGAAAGREWVYRGGRPVIVAEELLEDPEQTDGSLCDYKFICFRGKPYCIAFDMNRFTYHRRNIYDTEWNDLHVSSDCPCGDKLVEKPENLSEMLDIASVLSADFPAVRVDLYSIQNKIYFGELTFFPWSGYVRYAPDSFDLDLGEQFILPKKIFVWNNRTDGSWIFIKRLSEIKNSGSKYCPCCALFRINPC